MRVNGSAFLADSFMSFAVSFFAINIATLSMTVQSIPILTIAFLLAAALHYRIRHRRPQIAGWIMLSVGLFATTMVFVNLFAAVLSMVGWMLFVIRRLGWLRGTGDDDTQVSRMVWDVIIMFATAIVMMLVRPYVQHGGLMDLVTQSSFLTTVVWRITSMRNAQVYYARGRGVVDVVPLARSLLPMAGIMLCGLLACYLFPTIRYFLFMATFVMVILYMALRNWRTILGGAAAIGALFVVTKFTRMLVAGWAPVSSETSSTPQPKLPSLHRSVIHIFPYWWLFISVAVMIATLTCWFVVSWRPLADDLTAPSFDVVISRSSLSSRRGPVLSGRTPLGRLFVRWLIWEEGRGPRVERGETARQYLNRIRGHSPSPTTSEAAIQRMALVDRYERERYGGDEATDDEVKSIEQALWTVGILGRLKRGKREKSSRQN